ncbi:hypothetical protein APY04_0794 [Hyphomicrobium sulfonivorans]|uniref:Uncharacterized protein n=1 Tax=Hyphomicrobium sulfonivorans TaxID=121290 RepID=A0A109BKX5_HYPSL|nr:hypothetical protein APY04_0794 [Hyphomicrobium sulfonivorans]
MEVSKYQYGMTTREALLAEIEDFLMTESVSASEFGRSALNDTSLVMRLRSGADLRLSTADKLRAFMREFRMHRKTRRTNA